MCDTIPVSGVEMMQFEGRRFEHQRAFTVVVQMKGHLVGHAGDDARRHAAEHRLDRAVVMAAPQAEDLVMALENRREFGAAVDEPNSVHVTDAAVERWMVHEDNRRALRFGVKRVG